MSDGVRVEDESKMVSALDDFIIQTGQRIGPWDATSLKGTQMVSDGFRRSQLQGVVGVDDVASTCLPGSEMLADVCKVVCGPLQASPLLGISEPAVLTWSTEMWMI